MIVRTRSQLTTSVNKMDLFYIYILKIQSVNVNIYMIYIQFSIYLYILCISYSINRNVYAEHFQFSFAITMCLKLFSIINLHIMTLLRLYLTILLQYLRYRGKYFGIQLNSCQPIAITNLLLSKVGIAFWLFKVNARKNSLRKHIR